MRDYFFFDELKEETGMADNYLYSQLRSGKLRGFKLGKKWAVNRGELEKFLKYLQQQSCRQIRK